MSRWRDENIKQNKWLCDFDLIFNPIAIDSLRNANRFEIWNKHLQSLLLRQYSENFANYSQSYLTHVPTFLHSPRFKSHPFYRKRKNHHSKYPSTPRDTFRFVLTHTRLL